ELVDARRIRISAPVRAFDGENVVFTDGAHAAFDTVIFCTGFRLPRVPFVDCEPADLYRNHLHPDHAKLAVIGMYPTTLGCFSTIERGARWFALLLSDKVPRPDRAAMMRSIASDRARAASFADEGEPTVVPVDTPVDNIWFAEQIGAFPD